jgi:hypothetical protein
MGYGVGSSFMDDTAVTVHFPMEFKTAALASGGKLTVSADKRTFSFALGETVDALIFR